MIRWGIIGAGNIAGRFANSLVYQKDSGLYAISGRNEEKLKAFREKHPCEKIYIGHQSLLEDPAVDAVYIALPHSMHCEWSVKALQAGKAVLSEKPAVMNAGEMKEIIQASRISGKLFMEAMKPRFEPAYIRMKEILAEGRIGTITSVKAENCFLLPKERYGMSYHTCPGQGGALLDSGCYCVNLLNDLLKGPVTAVHVDSVVENTIDLYVDAELEMGGVPAECITGFDRNTGAHAVITGTRGRIEVEHPHRPDVLHVITDEGEEIISLPYEHDDFYAQIDHFCSLIRSGARESNVMSLQDSLRNAEILDQIRAKIREAAQ